MTAPTRMPDRREEAVRGNRLPRLVAFVSAAVGLIGGGYLAALAAPYAGARPWTVGFFAMVGTVLVTLVATAWAVRRKPAGRTGIHLLAIALCLGLGGLALQRWCARRQAAEVWPPRPAASMVARLDQIEPAERAHWGAMVVAHRIADGGRMASVPTLPESWPFPDDAVVAVDSSSLAVTVWVKAGGDAVDCVDLPTGPAPLPVSARCKQRMAVAGSLPFVRPVREAEQGAPELPAGDGHGMWLQYRNGPSRPGVAGPGEDAPAGWRAVTEGPIRASASVVAGTVLIGGQGTGALTALSLGDGHLLWRTRLPNWIHQDPVSDGRVVVATFGDNGPAFLGRAPGGIAAYALGTGQRLWTRFDESSVMTSAVLLDSFVVYVSGAGILRQRALRTGELLRADTLPGGAVMGPAALVGDTMVIGLDPDAVCAINGRTLERYWCRRFAHLRAFGSSAVAVHDGLVILTAQVELFALTLGDVRHTSPWMLRRLLVNVFQPWADASIAGQVTMALRLADGQVAWEGPTFGFRELAPGHISGTATIRDSIGVVVLPMADTLVGFDPTSGAVRWTSAGLHGRGPPLLVEGRAIIAGHNGTIEIRDARSGALQCVISRATGYDRMGPTLAGGLVVFLERDGMVEALPLHELLGCTAPGARTAPGSG